MAKRVFILPVLVFSALALFASTAMGKVAWQALPDMKMTSGFKDIAVTLDGRWTFVLTGKGDVLIYSPDGKLEDTIETGGSFDSITCSTVGDKIYLGNRSEGTLQVLELEFLKQIDTQGAPVEGAPGAPIEIVVFTDFQCPYCAALVPVLKQVLEKYPGKVKVVFKNFPLEMHRMAAPAAIAALAAQKQGKFWPYHDKLFENQKELSEQKFTEIATELKLDLTHFNADLKAPELQMKVRQDMQDGRNAEVRGTPAVFINGKLLKDRSLKGFSDSIEKLLQAGEEQKKK